MKTNRKYGWIVALPLFFLILPMQAKDLPFRGSGTPDDPYQIATAVDLIAIGQDPNLLAKHFVLVADIDLDPSLPRGRVFENALIAQDQDPNPNAARGQGFHGVLDGQGHVIKNLCMSVSPGLNAGLFGLLGPNAVVMDLHLSNAKISGSPAGTIAGHTSGGLILRCTVNGQVSGPNDIGGLVGSQSDGLIVECDADVRVTGDEQVGGLCGILWAGQVTGCSVKATVTGKNEVGGAIGSVIHDGHLSDTIIDATVVGTERVGGLTGSCSGSIQRCLVEGLVTGQTQVAGLVGWLRGLDPSPGLIVSSTSHCKVIGHQQVGGLVGQAGWGVVPTAALIMDSYAKGSIVGNVAGGLIGQTGPITLLNCYAACQMAPATSEDGLASIGGLFGKVETSRSPVPSTWSTMPLVTACFWDAQLSGLENSTGGSGPEFGQGLSTKQMKRYLTFAAAGWDMTDTWAVWGDYPYLQWETPKRSSGGR